MAAALTVERVACRALSVPLRFALGTSAAVVRAAPILLVDLTMADGVVGRTYLFCYRPSGARAIALVAAEAADLLKGMPTSPLEAAALLQRRYALLGVTGPVRMALAALDACLWDALAVASGQPLAALLGGRPRPVRAYNSSGLGLMKPEAAADEAEALLEGGFRALKLRLGYPTLAEDLAVTRAVRRRIADDVAIFVDYNQALPMVEALARGRALQAEGVAWIEEPVRHDDYAGNALIARDLSLPLQLGENFNGPEAMAEALARCACDLVMPDVARIGGVTGWMQAAALAAAHGVPMSSHLMPELSAHLLAATPTADWLEYVDWADAFLAEPLVIRDGAAQVPSGAGTGLAWNEDAVRRLALD